ncbi:unnamed protein product, partial [Musa acuminata subsp. burmannicoides]
CLYIRNLREDRFILLPPTTNLSRPFSILFFGEGGVLPFSSLPSFLSCIQFISGPNLLNGVSALQDIADFPKPPEKISYPHQAEELEPCQCNSHDSWNRALSTYLQNTGILLQ